ncbi:MAG: DUF4270 domain-containing protein [Bacteroidota bacterium]
MKNFRSNFRYHFLCVIVISVLGLSCNKNEELGMNVQPGENMLNVTFNNSMPIYAHTIKEDSVRTDETTLNLIGSIYDSVFGLTTAGMYTQLRLTTDNVNFGTGAICDSIMLSIAYSSFYGDTNTNLTLNVFEISDDFTLVNAYYSNDRLGIYKNNLANINFMPKLNDSVKIDGSNYAPQLRVKLKNSLGQKFIDASGTSYLANNTNFIDFFKGLYITTNPVSTSGTTAKGVMLYFNALSSLTKLTMYYHNDADTLAYKFVLNDNCARFNTYDHHKFSVASSYLKQQIAGDTVLGDSILYLQSMAGTRVKLKFPDVATLSTLGNIAVNKAELVIKADASNIDDTQTPPDRLSLAVINTDGTLSFLPDVAFGEAYYGGAYNTATNEYRFNITKYIQKALLNDSFDDNGLYLVASGSAVRSNRVVLFGPKNSKGNMHLDIIYTKIK